MKPERYFIGWHRPALHLIAEYLRDNFAGGEVWDLSSVVVVVPGARAGRRLLELLAWYATEVDSGGGAARRPVLFPPQIVTAGRLPEKLCRTGSEVAGELDLLLARIHALRGAPRERLSQLFAAPPDVGDFSGWAGLARELEALDRELEAEGVSCAAVIEHCRKLSLANSCDRWTVLQELQQSYLDVLHGTGLTTPEEARQRALEGGQLKDGLTVILAATVELPGTTCRLLEASGCRVVALVHAPPDQADGFDDFGRLRPGWWSEAAVPLEDDEIHIVDQPRDQARAVADILAQAPEVSNEQITVGLGDDKLGAVVERALELSGRRARRATNMTLGDSPPAQLLSLLAAWAGEREAADFAALIRHPDLGEWLGRVCGPVAGSGEWPIACDEFRARRLPVVIDAAAAGVPAALAMAAQEIAALLPARQRLKLNDWPQPLGNILATVYGGRELNESIPDEARIIRPLRLIGAVLQQFGALEQDNPTNPELGFSEAVGFLLSLAGGQPIPEDEDPNPQVELLGWLEVHLDDAPMLMVTGFNEGAIPGSVNGAPLLPDALRRDLGLVDNRRRYARDAYLLTATKYSRQKMAVICGRRTATNDPLTPSRLLFACDEDAVVRRTLQFYGEHAPEPARPLLLPHRREYSLAALPRPLPLPQPINELSVTSFKDYLACPYRFFLKHICRLRTVSDDLEELGGDLFGGLAHNVLSAFGQWVISEYDGYPPADSRLIDSFIEDRIRAESEKALGRELLPAVQIQLHQLQRRLKAFAAYQARVAGEGWRILHVEAGLERILARPDGDFRIHGRADRIDFHTDHGYRIIDYKTADAGHPPEKTHCRGKGAERQWLDLQLPLYRTLAPSLGIPEADAGVGYLLLPKDTAKVGYAAAAWDEEAYQSASEMADEIINRLRAQVFWPPSENLPVFDDGLSAICRDGSLDRQALIEKADAPPLYWPDLDPQRRWHLWPGWEVAHDE